MDASLRAVLKMCHCGHIIAKHAQIQSTHTKDPSVTSSELLLAIEQLNQSYQRFLSCTTFLYTVMDRIARRGDAWSHVQVLCSLSCFERNLFVSQLWEV